jgi:hypothetical protein
MSETDPSRQEEEYLNSPSGRHHLDIDLPKHWFRYFNDEGEEVNYCTLFIPFLIILIFLRSTFFTS